MKFCTSPTQLTDPSPPRNVTITRVFQDGVELNWLPPTEPNGAERYSVVVYSAQSGQQNHTCYPRHCNVTALRDGVTYSIAVWVSAASRANLTYRHTYATMGE